MDFGQNSGPDHQLAALTDGSKGDDFVHFETEEAAMNVKIFDQTFGKSAMSKDCGAVYVDQSPTVAQQPQSSGRVALQLMLPLA
jgi:hypothetical protein